MDYEQLNTKQLQDECRRRGLPSGRVKAELVQRLLADDAGAEGGHVPDGEAAPAGTAEEAEGSRETPPAPSVYRSRFPAKREGPGEQEHLDYRLRTYAAAVNAGCTPRGGALAAYRTGTADGHELYEIRIRRGA